MDSFEEQRYTDLKKKFDREKIWLAITQSKPQTKEKIELIESEFHKIKDYGEKLIFWGKHNLSPFKLQYEFTIYNENNEEVNPIISIVPEEKKEKVQYLNWVIKKCYEEYTNNTKKYNFETIPFEDLKKRFIESKKDRDTFIELEKKLIKKRIKETGVDSYVYDYITYKQNEPNVLSDLNFIDKDPLVISLQYFAIELSFVYDYIKYLIFLKSENKKVVTADEIISENKTFKSIYDISKLENIHSLLEEKEIIGKMNFDDFKLIFTETPIRDIKNKIVWLPKMTKGVDWTTLIIFVKEICGYNDSYFNTYTIKPFTDKIGYCFTTENDQQFNNYHNSIPRTIKELEENNFETKRLNKNFTIVKEIFSEIF